MEALTPREEEEAFDLEGIQAAGLARMPHKTKAPKEQTNRNCIRSHHFTAEKPHHHLIESRTPSITSVNSKSGPKLNQKLTIKSS
ncbi:hypothetical protein SynNOUM97013_01176 [Synechococcus sp. NOUM97013]|nr:hypothetical protein SynNOUM97013_01176 [Synechococcus sp. NOUM97013]